MGGNPRKGWTEVLTLKDLATLMPEDANIRIDELEATWAKHWDKLGENGASADAIDAGFDNLRSDILAELQ